MCLWGGTMQHYVLAGILRLYFWKQCLKLLKHSSVLTQQDTAETQHVFAQC